MQEMHAAVVQPTKQYFSSKALLMAKHDAQALQLMQKQAGCVCSFKAALCPAAKEVFTILPEIPLPVPTCLQQAKHMSEVVGVMRWLIEDPPKPDATATLQQADAASGTAKASRDSSAQQPLGKSVSKHGQITIGDLLNLDASVSNSGQPTVDDQTNLGESASNHDYSAESGQLNLPRSVGDHEQITAGYLHKLNASVGNNGQSMVGDVSDLGNQLKADQDLLAKLPQSSPKSMIQASLRAPASRFAQDHTAAASRSGSEPVSDPKSGPQSDSNQQDLTVPLTDATQGQTLTDDGGCLGAPMTSATEVDTVPTAGSVQPTLGAAAGTDNLSTDTHLLAPNESGKALPSQACSNQTAAETAESRQQSVGTAPARSSSATALNPAQPDGTQRRSAELSGDSELIEQTHALHEPKRSVWVVASVEDLPTPSQSAWQGLEATALRAAVALQWVVSHRLDDNPTHLTEDRITDRSLRETLVSQLVWLFHNMLAGHWHDKSLNMNRIFQMALAPLCALTASQADIVAALLPMLQRLAIDEALVKPLDAPLGSWQQQQQYRTGMVLAAMFCKPLPNFAACTIMRAWHLVEARYCHGTCMWGGSVCVL